MNLVLLRDNKIAFASTSIYNASDSIYVAPDLTKTMVDDGWFIPTTSHGMQALYWIDSLQAIRPHGDNSCYSGNYGDKGILVQCNYGAILFQRLLVDRSRKLVASPVIAGPHGFSVFSEYDHLAEAMVMCCLLTTTIEDAVDMYHRHHTFDREAVVIMDGEQIFEHMKKYHQPHVKKLLEIANRESKKKEVRKGKRA